MTTSSKRFVWIAAVSVLGLGLLSPSAHSQVSPIQPVPLAQENAIFYFNQRFIPEVAQTYTLTSPFTLSSVTFYPRLITRVEQNYFDITGDERHALEETVTTYAPVGTEALVSVWRSAAPGDLGPEFNTASGFTKVAEQAARFKITLGQPNTITLDNPVKLQPGTYAVILGMRFDDPNILTLHLAGRESGNNTKGGTLQQYESDCNYKRSQDSYTGGRAYQGTGSLPYTGKWDNYVGFGSRFIEHQAKVQECIAVGRFDTPFNPGDLMLNLNPPGYKPAEITVNPAPASKTSQKPPRIAKMNPSKNSVKVTTRPRRDLRQSTQAVVAFTTSGGMAEAGRCLIAPGKKSCVLRGLKSNTEYFVTTGIQENGATPLLYPNREPIRTR